MDNRATKIILYPGPKEWLGGSDLVLIERIRTNHNSIVPDQNRICTRSYRICTRSYQISTGSKLDRTRSYSISTSISTRSHPRARIFYKSLLDHNRSLLDQYHSSSIRTNHNVNHNSITTDHCSISTTRVQSERRITT